MPDTDNLKVGDVVHVEGTVVAVPFDREFPIKINPGGYDIWVARSSVVHVEPRARDRVRTLLVGGVIVTFCGIVWYGLVIGIGDIAETVMARLP